MKIYVASSWRNKNQPYLVEFLRGLGHEVYDFREDGFSWEQITDDIDVENLNLQGVQDHSTFMNSSEGLRIYKKDFAAMEWADCFVMLMPCGRSAHLEAGWAVGQGKPLAILHGSLDAEAELMYLMADLVTIWIWEVAEWLDKLDSQQND